MASRDSNSNGGAAIASTSSSHSNAAWATLVTGEKYLPGLAVFAESLLRGSSHHKGSNYPLVAMVTPDVSAEAIEALVTLGCRVRPVKRLHPGHSKGEKNMAFAHFGDVWTKLRAFELDEYDRIIMVDSDMLVRKNMDELFREEIRDDQIMATFACTCNPSKNPGYPKEWIPKNCAFTYQRHPDHTSRGMSITSDSPPTHHLLNSGLVVLKPSQSVMDEMEHRIKTDAVIETYRFPDQDFLADYFKGRFIPLPYVYNALKKLRTSHPDLWRDDEAKNVHYIINKPWTGQLKEDDTDAVTHQWWWDAYHLREWPEVVTKYVSRDQDTKSGEDGDKDSVDSGYASNGSGTKND